LTQLRIKRKKSPKKLFNVLFRAVAPAYKLLGGQVYQNQSIHAAASILNTPELQSFLFYYSNFFIFIYLDLGKSTGHSFRKIKEKKRKEKNVKSVFYYSRQTNNR
jgi:hypothetical protein